MGGLKTPLYQNTKYALLSTPGGGDAASGITLMGRKAVTSHGASDAAPQQLPKISRCQEKRPVTVCGRKRGRSALNLEAETVRMMGAHSNVPVSMVNPVALLPQCHAIASR